MVRIEDTNEYSRSGKEINVFICLPVQVVERCYENGATKLSIAPVSP